MNRDAFGPCAAVVNDVVCGEMTAHCERIYRWQDIAQHPERDYDEETGTVERRCWRHSTWDLRQAAGHVFDAIVERYAGPEDVRRRVRRFWVGEAAPELRGRVVRMQNVRMGRDYGDPQSWAGDVAFVDVEIESVEPVPCNPPEAMRFDDVVLFGARWHDEGFHTDIDGIVLRVTYRCDDVAFIDPSRTDDPRQPRPPSPTPPTAPRDG